MAWLKVYAWERETWPEFRSVSLDRPAQRRYLRKLCRHFTLDVPSLRWSYRRGVASGQGGGSYHRSRVVGWAYIRIGKVTTMGTLCHEFAHHLDWRQYGGYGHRRSFRRALKRTYTWAKRWLSDEVPTIGV